MKPVKGKVRISCRLVHSKKPMLCIPRDRLPLLVPRGGRPSFTTQCLLIRTRKIVTEAVSDSQHYKDRCDTPALNYKIHSFVCSFLTEKSMKGFGFRPWEEAEASHLPVNPLHRRGEESPARRGEGCLTQKAPYPHCPHPETAGFP